MRGRKRKINENYVPEWISSSDEDDRTVSNNENDRTHGTGPKPPRLDHPHELPVERTTEPEREREIDNPVEENDPTAHGEHVGDHADDREEGYDQNEMDYESEELLEDDRDEGMFLFSL